MNQAIKDSCSSPGDAERGKIEQRSAVPLYQKLRMIVLRRPRENTLKLPAGTPQQTRTLRKIIIMSMSGFLTTVLQIGRAHV